MRKSCSYGSVGEPVGHRRLYPEERGEAASEMIQARDLARGGKRVALPLLSLPAVAIVHNRLAGGALAV